mmetsp:Transcript_30011/g.47054  ORF Transcript_30011/g.47054 Transcript_30011/m.47054 type:complete len:612 (+) Transcript_30011:2-1837(+)
MVVSDNNAKWKGEPIPTKEEEELGHWCAFLGQVPVIVDGPVLCGQAIGPKFDGSGQGMVTKLGENPVIGIALDSKPAKQAGVVKTLVFAGLNAMTGSDKTNDQYDDLLQQSLRAEVVVLQQDVAAIESDLNNMQDRMDEQLGQMIQFQDRVQRLEKIRQFDNDPVPRPPPYNTGASSNPATQPSAPAIPPQAQEVTVGIPLAGPAAAHPLAAMPPPTSPQALPESSNKETWMTKKFWIIMAVVVVVLVLTIGIAVGILLSRRGGSDATSTPTPTPTTTPEPFCNLVASPYFTFSCPTEPYRQLSQECQAFLGECSEQCTFCYSFFGGPNEVRCDWHAGEVNSCQYEDLFFSGLQSGYDTGSMGAGGEHTPIPGDYAPDYWCELSNWESQNYSPSASCMEEISFFVEQGEWETANPGCPTYGGPPLLTCPSIPWRDIPVSCTDLYTCDPECVLCGEHFGGPLQWDCVREVWETSDCEEENLWIEDYFLLRGYACRYDAEEVWACEAEFDDPEGFFGVFAENYYGEFGVRRSEAGYYGDQADKHVQAVEQDFVDTWLEKLQKHLGHAVSELNATRQLKSVWSKKHPLVHAPRLQGLKTVGRNSVAVTTPSIGK